MALALTTPVYSILAGLIEARSGLHYAPESRALLAEKLTAPAQEAGFESLLDYYYFLRYDPAGPAQLEGLIASLLVHETYFFREADQLRALVRHVLLPAITARGRARVWSAACATGEEPLSLAMLLDEAGVLDQVELWGTDLSQRALDRARRGEFNGRTVRALPPGVEGRWLDLHPTGVQVRSGLRERIHWRRVNLLDLDAVPELGEFDAILCRNVLIYFSDATAQRVVENLAQHLRPGGHLLVGTSESLLRFASRLQCQELGAAFFYTRASR